MEAHIVTDMELKSEYEVDLATLNLKFLHIGKRVKFASCTAYRVLSPDDRPRLTIAFPYTKLRFLGTFKNK